MGVDFLGFAAFLLLERFHGRNPTASPPEEKQTMRIERKNMFKVHAGEKQQLEIVLLPLNDHYHDSSTVYMYFIQSRWLHRPYIRGKSKGYIKKKRIERKQDRACAIPSPWQQRILKSRTEQDGVCDVGE